MNKLVCCLVFVLAITVVVADLPRKHEVIHTVDWFELNHRYDMNRKLMFDQVILWEWADYYYEEDGWSKRRLEAKVVDWYMVTKYRQQITEEEQKKKNREVQKEWVKRFGIGADHRAPPYTPPFLGGLEVPRYDHARKRYKVVLVQKKDIMIIYATSMLESWTRNDPEVDNQNLFNPSIRRNIIRSVD